MIKTERLLLRDFQLEDLPHMQRYAVREDYYRYLEIAAPTPASLSDYLDVLLVQQEDKNRTQFNLAIVPETVGHVVGGIRLGLSDIANKQGNFGYALDSDLRGHGYVTEALRAILRFGFETHSLHRIWAVTDTRNAKSCAVMERVGMKREETLKGHKLIRGRWRDSYIYAIVAPNWLTKN